MTGPKRVQRTRPRQKGAKGMPPGAKYVGRGSRWGNPFTVADCLEADFADTRDEARTVVADQFRRWMNGELDGGPGPEGTSWSRERRDWIRDNAAELRGRDLACWCPLPEPGQPDHCHAQTLLRLANPPKENRP